MGSQLKKIGHPIGHFIIHDQVALFLISLNTRITELQIILQQLPSMTTIPLRQFLARPIKIILNWPLKNFKCDCTENSTESSFYSI